MSIKLITVSLISALLLIACAANSTHQRASTGAAVGAITGAILGNQTNNNSRGRILGAAVGAMAGAAVGNYMDEQERELNEQLAEEQQSNTVDLVRVDEETLKLRLDSSITFDFDSDTVKSGFYRSLGKVANSVAKYNQTAVHVIGYTDSVGSFAYNQNLSERRATSVGNYLKARGVSFQRLVLRGEGENNPVANNNTDYGRAQNRRVEIYLKSIVEGREQEAFNL